MPRFFFGADVGATKTHALISDETGQAVGFGESGPGNPGNVGYDGLTAVLRPALDQALASAGISRDQVAGAGLGIAGFDWPSQRENTLRALKPLELTAPLEIVNDTIIGLLAGAAEGWGVAVVAGTGCNCRGWDQHRRREGRVTGFGMSFGEAAGATELVGRAVREIAYAWSRRGPPTRLSADFVELVGARDLEDLLEGLTTHRYTLEAEAAPMVFRAAAQGDGVALEAVRWAGRELGDMAVGVVRQLGFEAMTFDVVLVGSLYHGGSLLIEPLRETVQAVAPGARLVRLTAPPVIGSVLLAIEQVGLQSPQLRARLVETISGVMRSA